MEGFITLSFLIINKLCNHNGILLLVVVVDQTPWSARIH
jgi:hypothetical protein